MPTQLEKLIAAQERAEQQKHEAERRAKLAKKQIAELQRKERNHRLIVRGAYLEKLLREPEILTDEDVFKILEHAFGTPYVREHLTDFLAKKHQEATVVASSQEGVEPKAMGAATGADT